MIGVPSSIKVALLLLLSTVIFIGYRAYSAPKVVEMRNVYIVREYNGYDYQMRTADGIKFFSRFCPDYEPQFSQGQTLTLLKFKDLGACWSVAGDPLGYIIQRRDDGQPVIQ